ncbi:MAG TPA: hypothetical protein VGB79_01650 [Allosphingosinicella sp.]|jgi:hypothetical protein
MASLRLRLEQPYASLAVGESFVTGTEGWILRWETTFADRWDRVKLSNGQRMEKMPGNLILRVGGRDRAPEPEEGERSFNRCGPIMGGLTYIPAYEGSSDGVIRPAPDSYSISANLPEEVLRTLIDKVLAGQGPAEVTLSVPKLDYGVLPDGSDKVWHLDGARNWLAVDGVTFVFPSPPVEEAEEFEPLYEPEPPPPSAEVVALREFTKRFDDRMTWVYALLAALIAAVVFSL